MAATPKTTKRTIAKFKGHAGTKRVLTRADQDGLIGTKNVAAEDLVWEAGNAKLDVTDVQPAVLEYLISDGDFSLSEVEVPVSEDA